ncbi:MAG: DUF3810 domain-containing protein [Oscillospiraceae bacterium]|nr:DUF3810 domain-containing protein [Oscillospiraceae bacterium]
MENTGTQKRGLAAIFRLCPARHALLLVSALVVVLHLLTRGSHALNAALSQRFVRPVHRALSTLCARVPFSVAEVLLGLAAAGLVVYIILSVARVIRRPNKGRQVYITIMTLAAFGLAVYAGFCLLWGVYYYGDDFASASGLEDGAVSTEELTAVTEYFAALANAYAAQVPRDENGVCATDRGAVLARSAELYEQTERQFPCLAGPPLRAKGVYFSRVMSYTDFTGFFFPFTAEANVNTDFPPSLFAATVGHELAHQRGVAKEQEANFVSVLACLNYGQADFVYSAALLAYTHLGNALYTADREAWERVYDSLDEAVRLDFAANRAYWRQFDTPVQAVSNTVYEGFLHSYDQVLGLRSYGACVDLLVHYYYDDALAARG